MKSFLAYVADDLIRKFGTDFSRVAVVFPNKRAALFLNDHLARSAGKPIWSPTYITISDLFLRHSSLTVADPIKLVCDLHKVFNEVTGKDETLDQFYGWGQLLISDFDDVDKNLADASKVFANIRDIHELDGVAYLSEVQKAALAQFFSNFTPQHDTALKQKFLTLWNNLATIYTKFNARLEAQGLAYEGAIYRRVADDENLAWNYDTYVFIGFNMLHKVEQRLFKKLKNEGKARFYWDFDEYFMTQGNESGHFISQYLGDFPNELDNANPDIYRNIAQPKDIAYISAPTENVQARYVGQWLREKGKKRIDDGRKTAIVLCNESLLQAVIHSLPSEVENVNITTGYPLSKTPFATLTNALIGYQTVPSPQNWKRLLRHPYAKHFIDDDQKIAIQPPTRQEKQPEALAQWMADILQHIGTQAQDEAEDPFFQESLFRTYTLVNRLLQLLQNGDLGADAAIFRRLLNQLLSSTTIPFHGEPIEGLQIMGVLETRNLDFDHVLVLSCNEGNMPKGLGDASFIPYSIRKAYDLTTIDHKAAIYAYYFHALLQRATDVTLLYNNATEDGNRGEMSRFMLQFMVQNPSQNIARKQLLTPNAHQPSAVGPVEKDDIVRRQLDTVTRLSPTDLSHYLRCQLLFYYSKVAGIKEPNQDDDQTLDTRVFGNIFHRSAQLIYDELKKKSPIVNKDDLKAYLDDPRMVEKAVDQAFREELAVAAADHYNGLQIINRRVIIEYLRQLLKIDQKLAPFEIKENEFRVEAPFAVSTAGRDITIGGIIDRLDSVIDENQVRRIRVVDYKTGSKPLQTVASVEDIFDSDNIRKKHTDYYLQTMLYATILRDNPQQNPQKLAVSPALIFIQHASGDDYDPTLVVNREKISDIGHVQQPFSENLHALLNEIFNAEHPFSPTDDRQRCANCPYRKICYV
ncbi:MAG: PD-(D/E)XK nuclease family protein [Prevotella sp.]|nr:PD-(D/E)XK nuclease family protein [Prevotella sp.]